MTYTAYFALGDDALVFGLGPIGLMPIPLARLKGALQIYAVNWSGGLRADLACAHGADGLLTSLDAETFCKGVVDRAVVSAPPSALLQALQNINYAAYLLLRSNKALAQRTALMRIASTLESPIIAIRTLPALSTI